MGTYYSLNAAPAGPGRTTLDALETLHGAAAPPGGDFAPSLWCGSKVGGDQSLWTPFSPLQVQRGFLLERGKHGTRQTLEHKWGRLLRAPHHNFEVEIAPSAEVFVVVACDPRSAHMYAALLFSSSYEPHQYWRLGDATSLDMSGLKFPLTGPKPPPSRGWRSTLSQASARGMGMESPPGARPSREGRTDARPDAASAARRLHRSLSVPAGPTGELATYTGTGLTRSTLEAWGSVYDGKPWQRSQWGHLLLYGVREGLLFQFADSVEDCARTMQAMVAGGSGSLEGSVCLCHRVGTVGLTKDLVATLNADLTRDFKVKTDDHALRAQTNCVLSVMRSLKSLNLPLRGYELRQAAAHADLGPRAADVLAAAWEYLWTRVDP